jgi:hypothetical protein
MDVLHHIRQCIAFLASLTLALTAMPPRSNAADPEGAAATRTEYVVAEIYGPYMAMDGFAYRGHVMGAAPLLRLLTYKSRRAYFAPLDIWLTRRNSYDLLLAGPEAGGHLSLDERGRVQLAYGAAVGLSVFRHDEGRLSIAPTVRVSMQFDSGLLVGAGVRALVPYDTGEWYLSGMVAVGYGERSRQADAEQADRDSGQAPGPGLRLDERFGLELGLVGFALMDLSRQGTGQEPEMSLLRVGGMTVFVRLPTLRAKRLLWTPIELGGGVFFWGGLTLPVMVDTSPGVVLLDSDTWKLTVHLGLGYGMLIAGSAPGDYSTSAGGSGLMLSPTLRATKQTRWGNRMGTSLRGIVPLHVGEISAVGDMSRYAALLLWAFELAW